MTTFLSGLAVAEPRIKLDLVEIGRIFSGLCLSDREAIRREEPPQRVTGYRYGNALVPFYVDTKDTTSKRTSGGMFGSAGTVTAWFRGEGWCLSATMRSKDRFLLPTGVFHNIYKADWNYSLAGDVAQFEEDWITAKLLFLGNRNLLPGYTI